MLDPVVVHQAGLDDVAFGHLKGWVDDALDLAADADERQLAVCELRAKPKRMVGVYSAAGLGLEILGAGGGGVG